MGVLLKIGLKNYYPRQYLHDQKDYLFWGVILREYGITTGVSNSFWATNTSSLRIPSSVAPSFSTAFLDLILSASTLKITFRIFMALNACESMRCFKALLSPVPWTSFANQVQPIWSVLWYGSMYPNLVLPTYFWDILLKIAKGMSFPAASFATAKAI